MDRCTLRDGFDQYTLDIDNKIVSQEWLYPNSMLNSNYYTLLICTNTNNVYVLSLDRYNSSKLFFEKKIPFKLSQYKQAK